MRKLLIFLRVENSGFERSGLSPSIWLRPRRCTALPDGCARNCRTSACRSGAVFREKQSSGGKRSMRWTINARCLSSVRGLRQAVTTPTAAEPLYRHREKSGRLVDDDYSFIFVEHGKLTGEIWPAGSFGVTLIMPTPVSWLISCNCEPFAEVSSLGRCLRTLPLLNHFADIATRLNSVLTLSPIV